MNQLRIGTGVAALGFLVWIIGTIAPWSSIGDRTYPGLKGSELPWFIVVLLLLVVTASGLAGRAVAAAARWLLLPVAALGLLLTVGVSIDVATSTAADVAQRFDQPDLVRENAWGVWVSIAGAVISTVGGIVAVLAPSPRLRPAETSS